jgi:hypothetical protein
MISEGRVSKILLLMQFAHTALGNALEEEDEVERDELVEHAHGLVQEAIDNSLLLDVPMSKELGK